MSCGNSFGRNLRKRYGSDGLQFHQRCPFSPKNRRVLDAWEGGLPKMAEPILTWAGGKRQLLDVLIPRLPPKDRFNTYYEPFFGGGAVFFAIEPPNGHINDLNAKLMNFYQQVREHPEKIIGENKELDRQMDHLNCVEEEKEYYYERRDEFNALRNESGKCMDEFREAVLFLYLNRTCWNGLYRTNEKGEFNVPMGSKWTKMAAIEARLRQGYRVLQDTVITAQDFTYIEDIVERDDFVFFDPPYPGKSKTAKFKKYNPGGFSDEQQEDLVDLALLLDNRGAHVVITNAASAEGIYTENDEFMEQFRILRVEGERRINSDHTKRTNIGETDLVVTNFSPFERQSKFQEFRNPN